MHTRTHTYTHTHAHTHTRTYTHSHTCLDMACMLSYPAESRITLEAYDTVRFPTYKFRMCVSPQRPIRLGHVGAIFERNRSMWRILPLPLVLNLEESQKRILHTAINYPYLGLVCVTGLKAFICFK